LEQKPKKVGCSGQGKFQSHTGTIGTQKYEKIYFK